MPTQTSNIDAHINTLEMQAEATASSVGDHRSAGMPGRDLVIAVVIAIASALFCFRIRSLVYPGPGDFNWALDTARALLAGRDPYDFVSNSLRIPYPLPVALFGLPLLALDPRWAAATFFGGSSGLLAYGILRSGSPWRLIVFLSFPYWFALGFAQWSPLIMASWFFPVLAPLLVLVKPQNALPVALNRLTRPGVYIAGAVLLISLIIYPTWPWRWKAMLGQYEMLLPLFALPLGPLLLLALFRVRDPLARLLLAMSVLPFRAPYDLLCLWLIPATWRQCLLLMLLSWWVPLLLLTGVPTSENMTVQVLFVPALALLFVNHWRERRFDGWRTTWLAWATHGHARSSKRKQA